MKSFELRQFAILLLAASILLSGCDENFYLSESETAAYNSILLTESIADMHFDNLQGRWIDLAFDNSSGTPKLINTNLADEMRRTEMANLEVGPGGVSLDRLSSELKTQIGKWVEGRLELYTSGPTADKVRLTKLNSVRVVFLSNPKFSYQPERQSIGFDVRLRIVFTGEIEVSAVNWLVNIFTNINGTYPIRVLANDLRLRGEARVYSPYANAGRIRFQLKPEILAPVEVLKQRNSVPDRVEEGLRQVLTHNLSKPVDEVFTQKYYHFTLPRIKLTTKTTQRTDARLEVSYRSTAGWLGPDAANARLHVVTGASDGKIYHAQKSNGEFSKYRAIQFPKFGSGPNPRISKDPALVHSGKGQLELAAINQNGDLVYSHWRNESWGNSRLIIPTTGVKYQGRPAVAASAPGQSEIIVTGTGGSLWHHRRIDGGWPNPVRIPLSIYPFIKAPYRDPVAVIVGNKIVVVFAGSDNHLAAIAFDLETNRWGQATPFMNPSNASITMKYAPAAVATGEDRVDVIYVKSGGAVFHRILEINAANFIPNVGSTGIVFRGHEERVAGVNATTSPVLTCSTYKQPEMIVRGTDNLLRHNHFYNALSSNVIEGRTVNPGWQGWKILYENFFENSPTPELRVSEFSAAGTRTGKTEVAARAYRIYRNQKAGIFYNEFESGRFGRVMTPWKTVHWRGWETTGTQQFTGRPALAAVDRNFQMAHIGNQNTFGSTVHTERIAESNATYLLASSSTVSTSQPTFDPWVVSTGPGMFDTIAVRKDGRLEHVRRFSNGAGSPSALSVPNGETLNGFAATSYGNGFVDLAATTSARNLYVWRYRERTWSPPVLVGSELISAPIIMYAGAGQIELFGIDKDYHLFRWRFTNNTWQSRITIDHNFPINNVLFSRSSASSWGDGSVDLAVVGNITGSLFHRRIGPGDERCRLRIGCPAPPVFESLGGRVLESPLLTAFSPTNLNILAMQGLRWYSKSASKHPNQLFRVPVPRDPRLLWSDYKYIGGDEMIVGAAANAGRTNFVAVAEKDGRFYLNRNINGRWTGFRRLNGQRSEQISRSPRFLPAIASHSD